MTGWMLKKYRPLASLKTLLIFSNPFINFVSKPPKTTTDSAWQIIPLWSTMRTLDPVCPTLPPPLTPLGSRPHASRQRSRTAKTSISQSLQLISLHHRRAIVRGWRFQWTKIHELWAVHFRPYFFSGSLSIIFASMARTGIYFSFISKHLR